MSLVIRDLQEGYREPDGSTIPILAIERFEVGDCEQVVLVGESGGGKTTLLNVIAGITVPDAGQVVLDGVELTRLPEVARDRFRAERIGYVFQTFHLLPAFTALENVLLGMSFASKRVEEAIPLALGDTTRLGGFPILGTIPRYFLAEYAPGKKYQAKGEFMSKPFDAVIGSSVARRNRWNIGTKFRFLHGGMAGDEHLHEEEFTVVSVLEPTGTPNDKTVFVHLDGQTLEAAKTSY